jgi:hypothetical protein
MVKLNSLVTVLVLSMAGVATKSALNLGARVLRYHHPQVVVSWVAEPE